MHSSPRPSSRPLSRLPSKLAFRAAPWSVLGPLGFALLLLVSTVSCASSGAGGGPALAAEPAVPVAHEVLLGTLWLQTSAEWRALTLQTWRDAADALEPALADPTWTAALEQEAMAPATLRTLPPAVIVDVDETVLDNSRFEAELVARGTGFTPELWTDWVERAAAEPVPGALEFVRRAAEQGVTVFYVTNRRDHEEPATRENLERLGFPLDPRLDTVLTRDERAGWGGDKTTRRQHVAASHRVLLLAGDDLNDFVLARDMAPAERRARAEERDGWWGQRWFLFPNPVYGSWLRSLGEGAEREEYLVGF